jgi:hypothetical protein
LRINLRSALLNFMFCLCARYIDARQYSIPTLELRQRALPSAVYADWRSPQAIPRRGGSGLALSVPLHPMQQFITANANLFAGAETHSVGGQNSATQEFVYELRRGTKCLSSLFSGDVESRVIHGCVVARCSLAVGLVGRHGIATSIEN